jgi:hypothetical protein
MPVFYEDSLGAKFMDSIDAMGSADDELIDDPAALEAAQAQANGRPTTTCHNKMTSEWLPALGPASLGSAAEAAGALASLITMPLDAENIEYVWDPYPPGSIPGATSLYSQFTPRPFMLLVAPDNVQRARELVRENAPDWVSADVPTETSAPLPDVTNAMPQPPDVSGGGGVPARIRFGALMLVLAALFITYLAYSFNEAVN